MFGDLSGEVDRRGKDSKPLCRTPSARHYEACHSYLLCWFESNCSYFSFSFPAPQHLQKDSRDYDTW